MRNIATAALALLMALVLLSSCTDKPKGIAVAEVFLYDPCGGCNVENGPCKPCEVELKYNQKFAAYVRENGLTDVRFDVYNIRYPEYRKRMERRLAEHNVDESSVYPICFIGKTVLVGDNEIDSGLDEAVSAAARIVEQKKEFATINEPVYFAGKYCASCKKLDQLLKDNNIKHTKYYIEDDDNGALLQEFFALYGVSVETTVPAVFMGDKVLTELDDIFAAFENYDPKSAENTKIIRK